MTNFEEKLNKLEEISDNIKQSDISLEEALKNFEEGIKLAKSLEKELETMESKIQILMNGDDMDSESAEEEISDSIKENSKPAKRTSKKTAEPSLGLFDETTEITGTRS